LKRQNRIHHLKILQVVSILIAVIAGVFAWWTIGLSIDAADAFTPEPPVTQWTGTAIIVLVLSILTFLSAWVLSTLNWKR
jgi:hypothetical protein